MSRPPLRTAAKSSLGTDSLDGRASPQGWTPRKIMAQLSNSLNQQQGSLDQLKTYNAEVYSINTIAKWDKMTETSKAAAKREYTWLSLNTLDS